MEAVFAALAPDGNIHILGGILRRTGAEAVETVRLLVGATNSRKALPGTIRGDFSMSGEQNVVHASDSVENALVEIARFFKPGELFDYESAVTRFEYGGEESQKYM